MNSIFHTHILQPLVSNILFLF